MALERRLLGRDGEIYQAYIRGRTQSSIAAEHGITQPRVSRIIKQAVKEAPEETKAEQRQKIADLMDHWQSELAKLADREPIPAYSNGRPIVIKEGDREANEDDIVAQDHSGRMKAMELGVKMMESKRKMLGLDAPAQTENVNRVTYVIEGIDPRDLM